MIQNTFFLTENVTLSKTTCYYSSYVGCKHVTKIRCSDLKLDMGFSEVIYTSLIYLSIKGDWHFTQF